MDFPKNILRLIYCKIPLGGRVAFVFVVWTPGLLSLLLKMSRLRRLSTRARRAFRKSDVAELDEGVGRVASSWTTCVFLDGDNVFAHLRNYCVSGGCLHLEMCWQSTCLGVYFGVKMREDSRLKKAISLLDTVDRARYMPSS